MTLTIAKPSFLDKTQVEVGVRYFDVNADNGLSSCRRI